MKNTSCYFRTEPEIKNSNVNVRRVDRIYVVLALVLVVLAYFLGLFVDTTGDAGKYAAIARNIIESGDFINLKIHGEPYDQKPQLLFWLAALGLKVGGLHNWSFKLFPILYGFSGFWFTFKLGETLYNKNTGKLAALMLATSWVFFLFTMDVHTDLVLQANVTWAIWQLAVFLKTRRTSSFIWAFVAIGLAMVSKGPVGAAVPAFALGAHLLLNKQYKDLFHPRWILGVLIALAIVSPALISLYNQFGMSGLKFFFIENNVGRITGSYVGNNTDYFFYLHTVLYLVLPWTFLLLYGFYREIGSYFRPSSTNREYFTLGGIWVFVLIASVARGKAPHYIFMLIPMVLVVVARWINEAFEAKAAKTLRRILKAQTFIPFLILAFLVLVMGYLFPPSKPIFWALPLGTLALVLVVLKFEKRPQVKLFLPSVLMMATLIVYLNGEALPAAYSYQASTRASRIFNREAQPGEAMYNYLYHQFETYFYSNTKVKRIYSVDDLQLDNEHASWVFTTEAGKDSLLANYGWAVLNTYPLKHKRMTSLTPRFLNPATREQTLEPMYLFKLQAAGSGGALLKSVAKDEKK